MPFSVINGKLLIKINLFYLRKKYFRFYSQFIWMYIYTAI
jgi:hypothetical protein